MQLTTSQKRNVLIMNIIAPFLMGTGIDLCVPSLPAISQYFSVTSHTVQFIVALYMLGYSTGQFFLSLWSDHVGRRKILIGSALAFTVFSLLAAWAPHIYLLNFLRLGQGFAIGGLGAVCRAVATECFFGIELKKAMTYISISWSAGPIIAPFIGGYLQHYFNWQACFYFFACGGAIVLTHALLNMPETLMSRKSFELRRLLKDIATLSFNPLFLCCIIFLSLVYGILIVFNVIAPFLVQVTLHYPVVTYGHIALFMGTAYFLGCVINRLIIQYFKTTRIVSTALFFALANSIIMILLALFVKINLAIIIIPVFLIFFSLGFTFANVAAKFLGLFSENAGTTNALFGLLSTFGVFLMSSLATLLKTHTQIPLAILFFGMLTACLVLFFICQRLTNFDE